MLIGHATKKTKSKLSKNKVLFKWEQSQQNAFDKLVEALTHPPILAYANYQLPFIVHTDASGSGLGAVLYQRQGGTDRVIAYASRSLKLSERHYPAHKLEFLPLKWAVTKKFSDYLYGCQFQVFTDNNPLTYVQTTANLDATGHRWLAALSSYDFTIKYRSGMSNADADGLSRQPDVNISSEQNTIETPVIKAVSLAASVSKDQAPLIFSVAAPTDSADESTVGDVPLDVIETEYLTSRDSRKSQTNDPVIGQVATHLRNGTRPSAKRVNFRL